MRRLGEILLEKGAISADGLRAAIEACRRHGGSLGGWLMRLGLVGESKLLEALAEQTGAPPVSALELAAAPREIRSLIPVSFAKRHMVVPFARQGRNLDVAMLNPNDLVLLDELASMTGMVIRPHVATEAALSVALALPTTSVGEHGGAPPGPPRGRERQWRQFWHMEASGPELFKALDAPSWTIPPVATATFPALAPMAAGTLVAVRELPQLGEVLASSTHRDQVGKLVLQALAEEGTRVVLFSVHHGKVMGWMGRGLDLVDEDLHTFILPLDRPSVFLNLMRGMEVHLGPLVGGEGNEALFEALGPPRPAAAAIVPIRVRGKQVAFLWLDRGEEGISEVSLAHLQEVARLAGLALEMLVVRQKLRSVASLTVGEREH
ncbi:MAG: hypothetical protein NZ869_04135 [Thermoanaerobaculum sp.]|nr:hypothetical protein [Thermoanaerobaculum sp.]MDW7968463.1 hypothetical protein [Thermoanaerobaculum sp.]